MDWYEEARQKCGHEELVLLSRLQQELRDHTAPDPVCFVFPRLIELRFSKGVVYGHFGQPNTYLAFPSTQLDAQSVSADEFWRLLSSAD